MSDRPQDVPSEVSFIDVVIANGASLSGIAALGGMHPVGIIVTGDWTNASITFEAKGPGSETFYPLHEKDSGTPITVAIGGSLSSTPRWYSLEPMLFAGVHDLRSGRAHWPHRPIRRLSARCASYAGKSDERSGWPCCMGLRAEDDRRG